MYGDPSPLPAGGRSRSVQRRRTAVLAALAALVAGILALTDRGRPGRHTRAAGHPTTVGAPTTAPRTGSGPPATSAAPAATARVVPPAVGSTTLAVQDGSRQFTADVFYPARSAASRAPLRKAGGWPLIVFSPGFDIDPAAYSALVDTWARAGYVVAEADYPSTAAGAPGGVNEADIVFHPADFRATLDTVLAQSGRPGDLLTGMVDPSRIGAAGHSDGGDVTDAVVADSCCRDPRVRAAAVLSGAELASFGGTYGPAGITVLVVQGDADQINAPSCSEQIYDGAGSPRLYLDLQGAGHRTPYLDTGPYDAARAAPAAYQSDVARVTTLFWQGYLSSNLAAVRLLEHGAGIGPEASLAVGAPVPRGGACPGAP